MDRDERQQKITLPRVHVLTATDVKTALSALTNFGAAKRASQLYQARICSLSRSSYWSGKRGRKDDQA
jgi:hypothetical protein